MHALIPVKRFSLAKQRLAGIVSPLERCEFAMAMLADILNVLAQHPQLDGVVLLSADPAAKALAARYGVDYLPESSLAGHGLNPVVQAAVEELARRGIDEVMILHADVPLVSATEIRQLIAAHAAAAYVNKQRPALTIAPDRYREGSNCMIASPAAAFTYAYGRGSFVRHCRQAEAMGAALSVIDLPGIGFDVDWPADAYQLAARGGTTLTGAQTYLNEINIVHRLDALTVPAADLVAASFNSTTEGYSMLRTKMQFLAEERQPSRDEALCLAHVADTDQLMLEARQIRDRGFRNLITYSRKIFIPLTQLCRDVCHYCAFAQSPKTVESAYMSVESVLATVRQGAELGCKEALFTLGEKPELRYQMARDALAELGFGSTIEYVAHVAGRVFEETGVLPHINAGNLTREEIELLRPVSASMGVMLESSSAALGARGMPHFGSPDKVPESRLNTIRLAGEAKVPFTSGLLIGIGETRKDRIEALLALRDLHEQFGHLQEIIIQNFRAKEGTKMAGSPEPDLDEMLWTIAVARLVFGPGMSIQAPPNLSPGDLQHLINAGINDWGGVSPLTPDFVNPEAPWPHLDELARQTAAAGKYLHERLTIYPAYAVASATWLAAPLHQAVLQMIDAEGYPRLDNWMPGKEVKVPDESARTLQTPISAAGVAPSLVAIVARASAGEALSEPEIVRLFQARGPEFGYVCQAADRLRQQVNGDTVAYVVNRNISYTNICYFKCGFCAFSKGKHSEHLAGAPYDLEHSEIARRVQEAWQRGATEVCLQGGIHPIYTGQKYLDILATIRAVAPTIHIHAFSPLEVAQGAKTLGVPIEAYLRSLKLAGLNTLPGTAAEILDDEVRKVICPDKIRTQEWLDVVGAAHRAGLKTTATIMFGHVDRLEHWARHLIRIRELQRRSGGFTEFVPLPFVAGQAPLFLKGRSRKGPTFRETLLMHSVARLVFHRQIDNIQTSWVKLGNAGILLALAAGANDLGGTLMNESITRAAGAEYGQEKPPGDMEALIRTIGREPRQRSTLYGEVAQERTQTSFAAAPLQQVVNTPLRRKILHLTKIPNRETADLTV